MHASSPLEIVGARGFYRPAGRVSAGELSDLITNALRWALDRRTTREVLINITAMVGFESPGPASRRWVARRWAETAAGKLAVALVARREHICPAKTGLIVA